MLLQVCAWLPVVLAGGFPNPIRPVADQQPATSPPKGGGMSSGTRLRSELSG
jgi:hypothetical protein